MLSSGMDGGSGWVGVLRGGVSWCSCSFWPLGGYYCLLFGSLSSSIDVNGWCCNFIGGEIQIWRKGMNGYESQNARIETWYFLATNL